MGTDDTEHELGRVLAVDYGRRRIGLAISDPSGTIATGLETLLVTDMVDAVRQITAGRPEWEYKMIVVGLPLLTSGEIGPMATEVLEFVDQLRESTGVTVETLDERYTSQQAERVLHETGRHIKGHKGTIDMLSAELLLRQYLDMHTQHSDDDL